MASKRTLEIEVSPELHAVITEAATRCNTTVERLAGEAVAVSEQWLREVRPWPRAQVEATAGRMAQWLRVSLDTDAQCVADRDLPAWWRERGRRAFLRLNRGPQREQAAAQVDRAIAKIEALTTTGRVAIGPA